MSDPSEKLITVSEARKILGEKYDKLPDETIQKIIDELYQLADISLNTICQ